eukprot:8013912-Lingulodinium_polyedra.AAC.1
MPGPHFGEKYARTIGIPSGSYMQVAAKMPLPKKLWPCNCNIPIQQHALDWYGKRMTTMSGGTVLGS